MSETQGFSEAKSALRKRHCINHTQVGFLKSCIAVFFSLSLYFSNLFILLLLSLFPGVYGVIK